MPAVSPRQGNYGAVSAPISTDWPKIVSRKGRFHCWRGGYDRLIFRVGTL
jgi:hypothetical protein